MEMGAQLIQVSELHRGLLVLLQFDNLRDDASRRCSSIQNTTLPRGASAGRHAARVTTDRRRNKGPMPACLGTNTTSSYAVFLFPVAIIDLP